MSVIHQVSVFGRSFVRSLGLVGFCFICFGPAFRLDSSAADAPWVSTSNTTLTFEGLEDGEHTLTVRARETLEAGGGTDKVWWDAWGGVG